jgi:GNAT superfamily N-acetyltransferase
MTRIRFEGTRTIAISVLRSLGEGGRPWGRANDDAAHVQVKMHPAISRDMTSNVTIRRAVATDADETAAMFTATLKSMAFFPKLHSDEEDRTFVARFIVETETWIAETSGRIVGLACIDRGWLMHLYMHPEFHNRGIGSALLAHVKARHPDGFQLWTFQANGGARRFYERHGCEAAEFTDGSRNEEKLADVRYKWPGQFAVNCRNSVISAFTAAFTIFSPASTEACEGSEPIRPSGKRRR